MVYMSLNGNGNVSGYDFFDELDVLLGCNYVIMNYHCHVNIIGHPPIINNYCSVDEIIAMIIAK